MLKSVLLAALLATTSLAFAADAPATPVKAEKVHKAKKTHKKAAPTTNKDVPQNPCQGKLCPPSDGAVTTLTPAKPDCPKGQICPPAQ